MFMQWSEFLISISDLLHVLATGSSTAPAICSFPAVATLARLREVARVRAQQVPSLTLLTRYLEVTPKQDYLVQRVHGEEEEDGEVKLFLCCVLIRFS